MPIFKGAGVAIVTPMKNNLEVDYDALETNINYQIDNGTDAIVIAGTTGESATLSEEEHKKVVKAAVEFTKHRVPVIAGTGSNSTQTAIELPEKARWLSVCRRSRCRSDRYSLLQQSNTERSDRTLHQRCRIHQSAGDHV